MIVRELINKLEGYDQDCQVLVRVQDGDIYNHVDMITLSRANPIIDVAKESMLAGIAMSAVSESQSIENNSVSQCPTINLNHDNVIDGIMKSNQYTMRRNIRLEKDMMKRMMEFDRDRDR